MIDTNKLIPQRKQSERLSGKTFTTIGLIKKDVVKIDSLLKEKLVLSKVRYRLLKKQNEKDRRFRRESILENKKSRPQDFDTNLKSNKKGKGFGGILGGIIKALLAGIGFTIFKSLPALLKIGKIIKIIATPFILGATVLLGGIARLATAGSRILPDVRGKNFEGASANSITNGIENFKGALIGAAVAFAGGALGGAITSRLVRGKTFTEKESIQELERARQRSGTTRARTRQIDAVEMVDDVASVKGRKIKKKFTTIRSFEQYADYLDAEEALKLEKLEREAASSVNMRKLVEQESGTPIRDFTSRTSRTREKVLTRSRNIKSEVGDIFSDTGLPSYRGAKFIRDKFGNIQGSIPLGKNTVKNNREIVNMFTSLKGSGNAVMVGGEMLFKDLGEGRLKPVMVRTGYSDDEYVVVRRGLEEGDKIVTSGNFLIAAESKLKAGIDQW